MQVTKILHNGVNYSPVAFIATRNKIYSRIYNGVNNLNDVDWKLSPPITKALKLQKLLVAYEVYKADPDFEFNIIYVYFPTSYLPSDLPIIEGSNIFGANLFPLTLNEK